MRGVFPNPVLAGQLPCLHPTTIRVLLLEGGFGSVLDCTRVGASNPDPRWAGPLPPSPYGRVSRLTCSPLALFAASVLVARFGAWPAPAKQQKRKVVMAITVATTGLCDIEHRGSGLRTGESHDSAHARLYAR